MALWTLGFFVFLRVFVAAAYHIPSGSMEGTLLVGDYVLIEKLSYGALLPGADGLRTPALRGLRRGDIVVFHQPAEDRDYVKRCVALAGDVVELREGALFVNGQPVREDYLAPQDATARTDFGPVKLSSGQLFVLGDHRAASRDSRSFGPLSVEQILGRAAFVYFSWDERAGRPRWRRILHSLR